MEQTISLSCSVNTNELPAYEIVPGQIADLDFIFFLFDSAILYQQKNGYDLWPRFSRELIATEIKEGRHWKIMQANTVVCIFSVQYSDPEIWKERNSDPAVYLHRIAVNPSFKGRKLMNEIRRWALAHAKEKGKKYVRMDTWGNNENLRNYYINCRFVYLGKQYLQQDGRETAHYGGPVLSLFQVEV